MKTTSALLIFPLLLTACRERDPILARVGDERVRQSTFLREIDGIPFSSRTYLQSPAGKKELMELLVRRKILTQAARDAGIDRTPALKEKLGALHADYERQKRELDRRYHEARERITAGEFLAERRRGPLKVTDDEVARFRAEEKEVRASHILVSDRETAMRLRARVVKAHESFGNVAREASEDAQTAAKRGDLGWVTRGSLVPAFETALFALAIGDVSDVVASPYGYHLILKTDERPVSRSPDKNLDDRLRQALEGRKLQDWFDVLRRRFPVRVDENALAAVSLPTPPSEPTEQTAAPIDIPR
jgi:parvulin-like peptidyl-prolyl isomerase